MIGLGLIEQIHPADILAHADPDDRDGDGISGKPNIVRDGQSGELTLGRFGWKAQTASIRQQSADAFAGDIGISTPEVPKHWGDCTAAQTECLAMPTGVQARLGAGRGAAAGDGSRHLLFAEPRRAGAPRSRQAGGARRQEGVLRDRLRFLPHAEIRHPPRRAQQGAGLPADLALFRLPAARHGRRSWPTASRWATRPAANGARRRCGASA